MTHDRIKAVLLFLFGLSLPYRDQFSTVFMLSALGLVLILSFRDRKFDFNFKNNWLWAIPFLLLFPRILGLFTGDIEPAVNEIIRSLPLLIIPMALMLNAGEGTIKHLEKGFFFGLLSGILIFFGICNYFVIEEMIRKSEPLEYLFRWRNLSFNFVQPINTHPPYLGLITIFAFVLTLFTDYIKSYWKYLVLFIIAMLLFQSMARNAIIVALLCAAIYSVKRMNTKALVISSTAFIVLIVVILVHPHPYLREKFLYKLNPFDTERKDKRFSRLEASVAVFKDHFLVGAGPGNDNALRKQEYIKMGDATAIEKNFNSHNQFFEYMVFAGLIGLSCFAIALFMLFRFLFRTKDNLYLILLMCFVLACLSESVLERSLGIKYFSVLMAFIMAKSIGQIKNKSKLSKSEY